MQETSTRRTFLKTAAAVATTSALHRLNAATGSPNSKLQHACIGVGGMGGLDYKNFLEHPKVEVVALCDVDAHNLAKAARKCPDARTYTDWRELLAKEGDRIDSINVSVPDHMHASITVRALRAGKHVYCQKPLCHDVAECRTVTEETAKAKTITQLGTQYSSGIGDRTAVEILNKGVIGKVKRVILSANRPGAIERYRLKGPRPAKGMPVPAHLDWDRWLGTAPKREYAEGVDKGIYHPKLWRSWQDFGTGWSGDMGCHLFDSVWKALALTSPRTVQAEVQGSWKTDPDRRRENWPQSNHITWVFPGTDRTAGDELVVEWFDGWFHAPASVQTLHTTEDVYPGEAAMFIGTEGNLLLPHREGPQLYPLNKFKDYPLPELSPRNHYHHFVDACLGGEMCGSPFGVAAPMTEAILLGTVAIRVPDTELDWDAGNMKIPGHAAAEQYLQRSYRDGWQVRGLCRNGSA
jgi:predicted dehydrogenase